MEFFNKKEEVLDIELTPFGLNKLSQGDFSPEYYSFFDGDILYDYAYSAVAEGYDPVVSPSDGARGQLVEVQNDIEGRIVLDTPSMKTLKMRTGISSTQTQIDQTLREAIVSPSTWSEWARPASSVGLANVGSQPLYIVPAGLYNSASIQFPQDNFLRRPLGTSKLSSPYYPSWETIMYQGRINSSAPTYYGPLTSPGVTASIPQVDVVYNCKYYVSEIEGYVEADNADYYLTQPTDANNLQALTTEIFADGTYITVDRRDIVISVRENNADFFKENFDIEVFVSGSPPGSDWRSLAIDSNMVEDIGGGLIGTPPTQNDVEYYLTINVDREIDTALIDQLSLDNNIAFNSSLIGADGISTREYFIRDLYNPQEDICE